MVTHRLPDKNRDRRQPEDIGSNPMAATDDDLAQWLRALRWYRKGW